MSCSGDDPAISRQWDAELKLGLSTSNFPSRSRAGAVMKAFLLYDT